MHFAIENTLFIGKHWQILLSKSATEKCNMKTLYFLLDNKVRQDNLFDYIYFAMRECLPHLDIGMMCMGLQSTLSIKMLCDSKNVYHS